MAKTPSTTTAPATGSGLQLETLISLLELAQRLRCHRTTIYRLVRDGHLRPTWIRGKQLFTPAEVERFLAAAATKED